MAGLNRADKMEGLLGVRDGGLNDGEKDRELTGAAAAASRAANSSAAAAIQKERNIARDGPCAAAAAVVDGGESREEAGGGGIGGVGQGGPDARGEVELEQVREGLYLRACARARSSTFRLRRRVGRKSRMAACRSKGGKLEHWVFGFG